MFGNLKKKFSNALQESARLSETLQQQYLQRSKSASSASTSHSTFNLSSSEEETSPTQSIASSEVPPHINLAAGCNLLAKYEEVWETIHAANEENAQKGEQVAKQIEGIETSLSQQRVILTDLISGLSGIPVLVEKIQESMKTLQDIMQLNTEVEKRLSKLEDLCEECDLQEYMLQKQCELSVHKQQKMVELEKYRQRIASEHEQKIRKHEQKLRQMQRERQAVFEDAFQSDLAEYKEKGKLSTMKKETSKELALELEEVVLEDTDTKDALEEFLNL